LDGVTPIPTSILFSYRAYPLYQHSIYIQTPVKALMFLNERNMRRQDPGYF